MLHIGFISHGAIVIWRQFRVMLNLGFWGGGLVCNFYHWINAMIIETILGRDRSYVVFLCILTPLFDLRNQNNILFCVGWVLTIWGLKNNFQTFTAETMEWASLQKRKLPVFEKFQAAVGWPLRSCPLLRFYGSLISLACPHYIRCLSLLQERGRLPVCGLCVQLFRLHS